MKVGDASGVVHERYASSQEVAPSRLVGHLDRKDSRAGEGERRPHAAQLGHEVAVKGNHVRPLRLAARDGQRRRVEVHVGPSQSGYLRSAEAGERGQEVPELTSALLGDLEESGQLGVGQLAAHASLISARIEPLDEM